MSKSTIDWHGVARLFVHPIQVAILETLAEDDEPQAPTLLAKRFGEDLGVVSYHVRHLAEAGLLRQTRTRPVRGTVQHFYTLAAKARV